MREFACQIFVSAALPRDGARYTRGVDICIRDARPADLVRVQQIYAFWVETSLSSFEEIAPDLAEITRRYEDVLAHGFPYLVAETAAGEIGGYVYASPWSVRSAYRYTCQDSIYIDDAFRGRGIGRALVMELVAQCTALGFRQMMAGIGDSENRASIGLHRACGFEPAGLLDSVGFKFGRWVDVVLMQRPLGDGALSFPSVLES